MTHARFAVAAIVASVTIAVGLPEVIKQWCASVHAQTQTRRLSLRFGITMGR